MIYLSEIRGNFDENGSFPFCIPAISKLKTISLSSPVAFLVGANASGKSTLLESIAIATKRVVVGGKSLDQDETLDAVRPLASRLNIAWKKRTSKGFFFRSEDFFNFMKRNRELSAELDGYAARFEDDPLARDSMLGQKKALESRYGDLNAQSHGEGFLQVFRSRIVPGGLYLLDEPEAALSPISQLSLLYLMNEMISNGEGAQFIIATHSPLLMSFPNANIFSFDEEVVAEVKYDHLEHVNLYKRFLADPKIYLERLFAE